MIEETIIEWLDLGDSVQKTDIYEKKKLLIFFKYHHLLLKHGIVSEILEIIFHLIFFLQIMNLAVVNIIPENDLLLKILKYIEIIIIPHNFLSSPDYYILSSSIIWIINLVHLILTIVVFVLLSRKIVMKLLFFIISIINYVIYYYLIGPIIYLAIYGTFCKKNNVDDICYSDKKKLHLLF